MRSAFRAKAHFSRSNPPSNPRDNPRVRVFRGKKHLQNRSSGTSSSSHKIDPSHRNRTHQNPRKKHAPLLQDPNMVRAEDEDVEHKKLISFIFLARFYSNRSSRLDFKVVTSRFDDDGSLLCATLISVVFSLLLPRLSFFALFLYFFRFFPPFLPKKKAEKKAIP